MDLEQTHEAINCDVIGHVIKYSQLEWKGIQHYNFIYNIIILYEFHGLFLNNYNIMDL
jgi:hypothetical protein